MTIVEARRILVGARIERNSLPDSVPCGPFEIHTDGSFSCSDSFASYEAGEPTVCLDDDFTADELEAMAVLMRATQS